MAKSRDKFKEEYKWNVKDLFKSDKECLNELDSVRKIIPSLKKYEGIILENSDNLLELLKLDLSIARRIEKLYIYAHINNDADTLNMNYQELFGKVYNAYVEYAQTSSYIVPELLASDYRIVNKYIKENKDLKEYERLLKDIYREKEHVLSKEVESALSSFNSVFASPEEIFSSLVDSDIKFDDITVKGKKVELTDSNYSVYIKDKDREVRKQAFNSLYKTFKEHKNTIAKSLKGEVDKNVAFSKLKKFNSSLEASLFSDEIDKNIYLNLIDTVHKNLKPMYRFWKLKKKQLNLKEMHIYDTYADISKKSSKKYSFEEARDLILKIVEPLGDTYKKDLERAFKDFFIY